MKELVPISRKPCRDPGRDAVVSMPYVQMDITDEDSVESAWQTQRRMWLRHCAAWTAVDLAEDEDEKRSYMR